MSTRVVVSEEIVVCAPKERALDAVWRIEDIERTERKADSVRVHAEDERNGTYEVRGRFAGVRWTGAFRYRLHEAGFHSRDTRPQRFVSAVEGGFIVDAVAHDICRVSHYEEYEIPAWLVPLRPLIRAYLARTMRKELVDLRSLILAA